VMKIFSFSAAPPISQFHPNYKSNPCLLAPIAISNLASFTSGIDGAGFLRSHSLFVSTIQRLPIMARPERLPFISREPWTSITSRSACGLATLDKPISYLMGGA
jgi:hypothetical protein